MEISLVWKYILVVICIAELSTAKKPRTKKQWKVLREEPDLSDGLDLKGILQRQFFAETALADTSKNAVASPFSALLLLATLALGTAGEGLKELEAGIGTSKDEIEDYFKNIFHGLSNMKGASLCVANKIYLQKDVELRNDYQQTIKKIFSTTYEVVDFMKPKETVASINMWVSSNTNGKIPRMLTNSDVGPEQIILIINTLHFTGRWDIEFVETKGDFRTPNGVKSVKMMDRRRQYRYANSSRLDAQIISVPYAGRNVDFYIVLPREKRVNIARVMETVRADPEVLDDEFKMMESADVHLKMPVFEIEAKFDLAQIYQELGVKQIFMPGEGLEGVTSSRYKPNEIFVSGAIHKAYINVTAKGTEAGAASAASVHTSRMVQPERMVVDRPFLFFIVAAKQQLFSGFVVDPSK